MEKERGPRSREARARWLQRYIHARVQEARGEESWHSLAQRAGIPWGTIAGQKKNRNYATSTLWRIAKATGRPIEYFFPPESGKETEELPEVIAFRKVERAVKELWDSG